MINEMIQQYEEQDAAIEKQFRAAVDVALAWQRGERLKLRTALWNKVVEITDKRSKVDKAKAEADAAEEVAKKARATAEVLSKEDKK